MHRVAILLALFVLGAPMASAQLVLRTFDQEAAGAPPHGFSFAPSRQQSPGRWLVREDGSNRFLAHLADPPAPGGLSLATLDALAPERLRASVRLRLTDGERTGGLVWRYHDADNFYFVALDLLEQEIALYRVVRGNRVRLDREDDLELDQDAWYTVRVVHEGERIRVALGGIGVIRSRDNAIAAPGRAGVWSGGGTTSWFDDLRVEEEIDDDGRDGGRR